jgi:hypothetical protein
MVINGNPNKKTSNDTQQERQREENERLEAVKVMLKYSSEHVKQ